MISKIADEFGCLSLLVETMSGVGSPEWFSDMSRVSTLGKLKPFLKHLKLSIQMLVSRKYCSFLEFFGLCPCNCTPFLSKVIDIT